MPLEQLTVSPIALTKHSDGAMQRLVAAVSEFCQPLVYNDQLHELVDGHGRLEALASDGQTLAPVIRLSLDRADHATLALRLRAKYGTNDNESIDTTMQTLHQNGTDPDEFGWPVPEVERRLGLREPETREKPAKTCPKCGTQVEG